MKAEYGANPFSGVVHVFRAKRADRVKLVWWDGTGLWLMAKALLSLSKGGLSRARSSGPVQDGVMRLTAAQAAALLDGLDCDASMPDVARSPQIAG